MERLGPDHLITHTERCVVFVAGSPASGETLKRIDAYIQAASRRQGARIGYLHVMLGGSGATKVDQHTVVAFAQMIARSGKLIGAGAVVVGHTGFLGGAVRAAVSGLFLAARPPFPTKVTATTAEATQWLAVTVPVVGGAAPDAGAIEAAIATMTAEVRPAKRS
jgi:hypothetical protein